MIRRHSLCKRLASRGASAQAVNLTSVVCGSLQISQNQSGWREVLCKWLWLSELSRLKAETVHDMSGDFKVAGAKLNGRPNSADILRGQPSLSFLALYPRSDGSSLSRVSVGQLPARCRCRCPSERLREFPKRYLELCHGSAIFKSVLGAIFLYKWVSQASTRAPSGFLFLVFNQLI